MVEGSIYQQQLLQVSCAAATLPSSSQQQLLVSWAGVTSKTSVCYGRRRMRCFGIGMVGEDSSATVTDQSSVNGWLGGEAFGSGCHGPWAHSV